MSGKLLLKRSWHNKARVSWMTSSFIIILVHLTFDCNWISWHLKDFELHGKSLSSRRNKHQNRIKTKCLFTSSSLWLLSKHLKNIIHFTFRWNFTLFWGRLLWCSCLLSFPLILWWWWLPGVLNSSFSSQWPVVILPFVQSILPLDSSSLWIDSFSLFLSSSFFSYLGCQSSSQFVTYHAGLAMQVLRRRMFCLNVASCVGVAFNRETRVAVMMTRFYQCLQFICLRSAWEEKWIQMRRESCRLTGRQWGHLSNFIRRRLMLQMKMRHILLWPKFPSIN